jgi:hypothetical protein
LTNLRDPQWLRQQRESRHYYTLFQAYRGSVMGETEVEVNGRKIPAHGYRSVRDVAKAFQLNPNTVYSIAARMKWTLRLETYDKFLDELERTETQAQLRRLSRGWARQRIDRAKGLVAIAEALEAKTLEIAKDQNLYIKTLADKVVERYPDGRTKTVIREIHAPAGWRHRDAGTLAVRLIAIADAYDKIMMPEGEAGKAIEDGMIEPKDVDAALKGILAGRKAAGADGEAGDDDDDDD